jgi:quercetin dioxygenase-like cupin family protein
MPEILDIAAIKHRNGWSPIRRELGVQAFGINAWSGDDGASLVGEHDEKSSGHEELYIVFAGSARFTVDGEDTDAPTGTVVFVRDPLSRRAAVATADGTTLISVGGKPGAAYEPLVWEVNAQVFELFGDDQIAEAKEMVTEALDRFEDRAALLYNLACCEARLGEIEPGLGHLAEALAVRPSLNELARGDTDLDALRGEPRFDELVGAPAPG